MYFSVLKPKKEGLDHNNDLWNIETAFKTKVGCPVINNCEKFLLIVALIKNFKERVSFIEALELELLRQDKALRVFHHKLESVREGFVFFVGLYRSVCEFLVKWSGVILLFLAKLSHKLQVIFAEAVEVPCIWLSFQPYVKDYRCAFQDTDELLDRFLWHQSNPFRNRFWHFWLLFNDEGVELSANNIGIDEFLPYLGDDPFSMWPPYFDLEELDSSARLTH